MISQLLQSGKIVLILCLVSSLTSCSTDSSDDQIAEGRLLTQKYCGNCHLAPAPELLDKQTWAHAVLPAMAEQLGIEVLEGDLYLHSKKSVISTEEWAKIRQYFETLAPDSLVAAPQYYTPESDLSGFKPRIPAEDSLVTSTTVVAFETVGRHVLTGSAANPSIVRFDSLLRPQLTTQLPSVPVDIQVGTSAQNSMIVTCMGGMRALDNTKGQVLNIISKNPPQTLSSDLTRPIKTKTFDQNKDGLTDYIVCAFGHMRGGLYLLTQTPFYQFTKTYISELPGVTDTHIRDFNNDGFPDIMALFAHGDESIWLFTNDQKGGFSAKRLLRFPPVYGSSSFQLVDFDKDGKEDILYTAGDNSDYSRILKPYHGVYIFTNQGNFQFRQSYFYPINGCTKAIAEDYDLDGNIDIAAIAFFADLKKRPQETFTLLKSGGGLKFTANHLPINHLGRWICMDAKDWDGDGDTDIVLGNFSRGFLNEENVKPHWNTRLPFIILENGSRRANHLSSNPPVTD